MEESRHSDNNKNHLAWFLLLSERVKYKYVSHLGFERLFVKMNTKGECFEKAY